MNKIIKTPKHTARPANWIDELISDGHATTTIRVGMVIFHLYPLSAHPSNRREAATVKAELIEAIDGLHFADLIALRDAVRILATDHAGARWACKQTRREGGRFIERQMGKSNTGGKL